MANMTKKFRPCVMRAAHWLQDDPSVAETVKSLARRRRSPSEADLSQLKQIGKYHVKYQMTVNEFVAQILFEQDNVCVDTDHAGCALTRRSTTGLATMLARHVCTTCKQHPVRDCVVQRRVGVARIGTRLPHSTWVAERAV